MRLWKLLQGILSKSIFWAEVEEFLFKQIISFAQQHV